MHSRMWLIECHFLWCKWHLWNSTFKTGFLCSITFLMFIIVLIQQKGSDYKSLNIGFHSNSEVWTPFGVAVACGNRYEYLLKGWANASERQSITNTLNTKELLSTTYFSRHRQSNVYISITSSDYVLAVPPGIDTVRGHRFKYIMPITT